MTVTASPTSSSSSPAGLTPVATGVLEDLRVSPTPYHAAARAAELLSAAGFAECNPALPLPTGPGPRFLRTGGSLAAWVQPEALGGVLLVGAHTDSPNLRVRTRPDITSADVALVGVEVYGGVLLNSWLDRDLGLAGRVSVRDASGAISHRLWCESEPVLRIPQLAIHLDREIRDKGLDLNPQQHIRPMWALGQTDEGAVRAYVAAGLGVEPEAVLAWDLMAFDTQPPAVVGRDRDLFASARIDNLVSSFCAVRALTGLVEPQPGSGGNGSGGAGGGRMPMVVLYDHEEIGSESATGASGSWLASVLERVAVAAGLDRAGYLAALARSLVISADGAHATHPNYADKHEPSHHVHLNGGVVLKRNANQRYATDAVSEAELVAVAADAGVPLQYYIHRNDLLCGSTIGPITAARLGVPTVDIGAPQLAMHSCRETAGVADLDHLHRLLGAAWSRP
ncbi:MAG: M18 family aminopeptidase [Acidimicrobiia bacterium]|nr:M18 family aminopeptidase [Acidimicrobiia bacterium]MDH5290124.1 M18 family aminopeptidase [Acidimicrobiia bacterium]